MKFGPGSRFARAVIRTAVAGAAVLVCWTVYAVATPRDYFGITDTEYTPGFSRAKLRQLSVGDLESTVLELLGEPYQRYADSETGQEYWPYSRSPGSTHYWRVQVTLDSKTRTVTRIHNEFYFD